MGKFRLIALAVIAALVVAVIIVMVWPSAPDRKPTLVAVPPLEPVTRNSVVIAPVAIALSAIRDVLDAAAPRDFAGKGDNNPLGNLLREADIGWTAARGPLTVVGRPEGMTVSAPLNGTLRITGKLSEQVGNIGGQLGNLLGGSIGSELQKLTGRVFDARADVRGNITMTSRPAILPEWRLDPNLVAQVTMADTGVGVAGVRVGVPNQVKPLLDRSVNEQVAALQARIRSDPFIEAAVRREWEKLCRAIPVTGANAALPNLWLEVRPTRAYAAQPRIDANAVHLVVGVQAETRIVPTQLKPTCPFPAKLDLVPAIDQGRIALAVPVDVPFTDVNRLLEAQLKGKTFPEDGSGAVGVTVQQATVAASGDRLLISLKVKVREKKSFFGFAAEGNVHIWGRPKLDREKQMLSLTDIEIDVQSESAFGLLGAAARAALPYVREALAENAVFDLKPFTANTLKSIDAAAAEFRKNEGGVKVDANITALRMVGIAFDAKTLRIIAEADGTAKVAVSTLAVK